ncbi:hypothetical protein GCM10018785_08020 [Streptomyces longispororuber]|uniref:Uncharacterized protein n=1 Tax=Streptomyces longispororuber TaxID=68230 RepID=A0A919DEI0_9ACTN|nr:DUF6069 family protein [Streptomyces longispororuber]GHE40875.1 hypothetical protein GCM10018785_08020 [Streptomyces longispororuber]
MTALAVLAPVLVWLVADPLLGHRPRITDGGRTLDLGAAPVAAVALLASLAGWALLAALERFAARRARAVWTGTACAVLAVSFLPLTGGGMDGGTRLSLALMHLAVAAVLIPGLGGGWAPALTPGGPCRRSARACVESGDGRLLLDVSVAAMLGKVTASEPCREPKR